jgi:hypothetical protein
MIRMLKAGPRGALRYTLLLLVFSITGPSRASTGDACEVLGQQMRALTSEKTRILRESGFVYSLGQARHLPNTVISERIVPGCPERLVAEKYFDNKIAGEERFRIGEEEFVRSRAAVAKAACAALEVSEPWPDGVSHEILNVVSDQLLPEWSECLYRHIAESKGYISLNYFTDANFQRPPQKALPLIRQMQGSARLRILDVALLLILEKNLTGAVSLERAKQALRTAPPMPDQQLSTQEIINRVLRLLTQRQPVSLEDAWTLEGEITGSWI